jgi:hypothetical protein
MPSGSRFPAHVVPPPPPWWFRKCEPHNQQHDSNLGTDTLSEPTILRLTWRKRNCRFGPPSPEPPRLIHRHSQVPTGDGVKGLSSHWVTRGSEPLFSPPLTRRSPSLVAGGRGLLPTHQHQQHHHHPPPARADLANDHLISRERKRERRLRSPCADEGRKEGFRETAAGCVRGVVWFVSFDPDTALLLAW